MCGASSGKSVKLRAGTSCSGHGSELNRSCTPQHNCFGVSAPQAQAWRCSRVRSPKPRSRQSDLHVDNVSLLTKVSSPENCKQVAALSRRKAGDFRTFPSSRLREVWADQKSPHIQHIWGLQNGGAEGTRTLGLRRDRPAL